MGGWVGVSEHAGPCALSHSPSPQNHKHTSRCFFFYYAFNQPFFFSIRFITRLYVLHQNDSERSCEEAKHRVLEEDVLLNV